MNARDWRTFGKFLIDLAAPMLAVALLLGLTLLLSGDPARQKVAALAGDAQLSDWAQTAGVFLLAPTVYFAWRGLRENRRIALLNTRATVILHCAERYDELYRDRTAFNDFRIDEDDYDDGRFVDMRRHFSRYWGLKSDEMDFYLADWVDIDTLKSWIFSLCESMRETGPDGALPPSATRFARLLRLSWRKSAPYHHEANPVFAEMVDVIYGLSGRLRSAQDSNLLADALVLQLARGTQKIREMLTRRHDIDEYRRLSRTSRRRRTFDADRAARGLERTPP